MLLLYKTFKIYDLKYIIIFELLDDLKHIIAYPKILRNA